MYSDILNQLNLTTKVKISLLGDIHGEAKTLEEYIKTHQIDVGLLTGDCSIWDYTFSAPIFGPTGNSEVYVNPKPYIPGKFYAYNPPSNHIIDVGGLKIAGLNVLYIKDDMPGPIYYSPEQINDFIQSHQNHKIDILLLHGSPINIVTINNKIYPYAQPELIKILDQLNPKLVVCGHNHIFSIDMYQDIPIINMDRVMEENEEWHLEFYANDFHNFLESIKIKGKRKEFAQRFNM